MAFETFLSDLFLAYINKKSINYQNTQESKIKKLIKEEFGDWYSNRISLNLRNAVPRTSIEDALHIAIATIQGVDFLLTWNFKHINNANMRDKIHEIITQLGYRCPVLCSPEELINEE
ncbi:MAG: hypothetical protein H7842_02720 [Gammaproteobacteria bacterium SHHR-1]